MRSALAGFLLTLAALPQAVSAQEYMKRIPAPTLDDVRSAEPANTIVLAGGCYWGMQAVFEHVKGVRKVDAGMSGVTYASNEAGLAGKSEMPAEAVQITFDPGVISYGRILQLYFSVAHDPTQADRQGPDVGSRYRSEIFYSDDRQKKIAQAYVVQLEAARVFAGSIATQIRPLVRFRKVDASQQDYVPKNPASPYVVSEDLPKLAALKNLYPADYVEQAIVWPG